MKTTDIPAPETVGANHNDLIRQILNKERSATNQRQRYVVQAWGSDGWQDTRYRSDDARHARFLAEWLMEQKSRWIDNKPTAIQVRDRERN